MIRTMTRICPTLVVVLLAAGAVMSAQERRIPSPPGASATEVGGRYDEREGYVSGKWLEIRYGRPIKRGRDLFGPPDHAEILNDGAPVWRAGANATTRLTTEVPIVIGGRTVAPGEYSIFIDLQPKVWTLIVSSWPAQTTYDEKDKTALFGAYDYTPDKDVVRVPMKRETLPYSFDQLSWQFLNMSDTGGELALLWDRQLARVRFEIAR
jgi:hypothetical protein